MFTVSVAPALEGYRSVNERQGKIEVHLKAEIQDLKIALEEEVGKHGANNSDNAQIIQCMEMSQLCREEAISRLFTKWKGFHVMVRGFFRCWCGGAELCF